MPPSGNPWSVKGIDPRARAIAKSAARRDGMTLGEWLNRVILDDEPSGSNGWDDQLSAFPGFGGGDGGDEDTELAEIVQRLATRVEASERRSTLALSGVDQAVLGLSRRLEALEDEHEEDGGEVEQALSRARAAQDELLERIRKLEKAGPGASGQEAVRAVEHALGKLASRLYETENEIRSELDTLALKEERRRDGSEKTIKSLAQRVDDAERKLSGEDSALRDMVEDRLRRSGEEVSALHDATRTLQQRLTAAEGATHRAAEMLGRSHEQLESRLKSLEGRASDTVSQDVFQRRFDSLAGELANVIRDTRADFARQIDTVARGGNSQEMRDALRDAETRISQAEQRQSDQLARIGDQIGKLARAMEKRLDETDRRLESRLVDAERGRRTSESQAVIEAQLNQVREENANAVRKMGEEVAKLGNSLADRVQQAEHRSARAVQAAGERMAQVVEKMQTRPPEREEELQARIDASETRTAQRIDEAMGKLHDRLDMARSEQADALTPVQRAMSALADRLERIESGAPAGGPVASTEAAEPAEQPDTMAAPEPEAPAERRKAPLPLPPGVAEDRREQDPFDIDLENDGFVVDAEPAPGRKRDAEPEEMARDARPRKPAVLGATADADFLASMRNTARTSRAKAPELPRYAPGEASDREEGGRGRWVLIGASVLSFLIIGAAAGLLILDTLSGERVARSTSPASSDALNSLFSAEAESRPPEPVRIESPAEPAGTSRAGETSTDDATPPADAERLPEPEPVETAGVEPVQEPQSSRPQPDARVRPVSMEATPPSLEELANAGDPVARYQLGLERLEAGAMEDAAALMRRAAEQGLAAAQYRYAQMLQRAEGVDANAEAARLWMVRAAQNGNVRAMHAAGAMFINADTTMENQEQAARWFEQGALHGLRDSQFNLALLFQSGYGVPESPADAYAWFLIAADNGDEAAATRAADLRRELSVEQRNAAEEVANAFTPRSADPAAQGRFGDRDALAGQDLTLIARAQDLLGDLGYDAGPADGDFGPQTREAIVAYQSDQGLDPTGRVDAALLARLEQSAPR